MMSYAPSFQQYEIFNLCWIAIGLITFLYLLKKEAPYGRFSNRQWGPMISNRLGWILMEGAVLVVLALWVPLKKLQENPVNSMLLLFTLHYVHRSFIYPFMTRTKGKKMPLILMLSAIFFNIVNGSLLGIWFTHFAHYPKGWLTSPAFIIGLLGFVIGMVINWTSDYKLIRLRKEKESGYKIPYGGLFNYISSPNLFGEILEWSGFALLTWSLPGLTFLIWTCANLIPRALSVHRWYNRTFPEYPSQRKVLFPFIW